MVKSIDVDQTHAETQKTNYKVLSGERLKGTLSEINTNMSQMALI